MTPDVVVPGEVTLKILRGLLTGPVTSSMIQPASISATSCPGEHQDFHFMGAILWRMTAVNETAECPQGAVVVGNSTIDFWHTTAATTTALTDAIIATL